MRWSWRCARPVVGVGQARGRPRPARRRRRAVEAGRPVERIHQRLRRQRADRAPGVRRRARRRRRSGSRSATPKLPSASRATIDQVIATLRRQAAVEHARDVQRLAAGAVGDLVAAAGAVGDDDRVGLLADRRQQAQLRPSASRPRGGSPRSRSCRPCRSTRSRSARAWRRGSAAARRGSARPRRTPSGGSGRAPGSAAPRGVKVEREAAGLGLAGEELLEQQRLAATPSRPCRRGPAPAPRRAASAGTTAPGRRWRCRPAANGSSASSSAPPCALACVDHAAGEEGAAAAMVAAVLARPCAACSRRPAARAPRRARSRSRRCR